MKESTRIQLELPQRAFDRVKRLKEMTEATSYAEVIRAALIHYERGLTNGLIPELPVGHDGEAA